MPRFKTIEDIVKAHENAGFKIYHEDGTKYCLKKRITVVKEKPDVKDRMFVFITNLRNGVETRIQFPHIKRNISGKTTGVTEKEITFKYQKTPEGLVLHSYDFEDKESRVLSGEITVAAEVLRY